MGVVHWLGMVKGDLMKVMLLMLFLLMLVQVGRRVCVGAVLRVGNVCVCVELMAATDPLE